jgi:hypothetical protein
MAVSSTGYDYGIRSGLASKGVDNSKIGYNNATSSVTVDGQDFMKADKNYNGTAFTNQQNFNSAWDAYNKAQQQPVQTGQVQPIATGATQYNPYSTVTNNQNPYTQQTDKVIQSLLNYGQNQPAYDPYSSAAYKASEAQAQRSAQQNTRAAQEAYGGAGFGRSYALGERAQGIQNDATEYLMTQVVPQLMAQDEQRRQQEFNNQSSMLQQLVGQQGRADNLVQQDFNNNITTAGLTGNYLPQGADQLISQLLALKGQAETKGITAADRSGLSSQADTLRSQLQAMGVDTTGLGANVNRANAASAGANIGTRTLAGQTTDQNILDSNRNFDRDVLVSDRDYSRGVLESDRNYEIDKTNATIQQRGANLANELAKLQLDNYPEEQRLSIERMKKDIAQIGKDPYQSAADKRMDELKIEMSELELEKIRTGTSTQPTATDMRTYFDSMVQRDKRNAITNVTELENAILNSELSDYDSYQMYLRYGIPWGGPAPTKPGN